MRRALWKLFNLLMKTSLLLVATTNNQDSSVNQRDSSEQVVTNMKISCRVRGDWFQVPCLDGNCIFYILHAQAEKRPETPLHTTTAIIFSILVVVILLSSTSRDKNHQMAGRRSLEKVSKAEASLVRPQSLRSCPRHQENRGWRHL